MEVNLEIGEKRNLKNPYGLKIQIYREINGYYIAYEKKIMGPFFKIILTRGNDKIDNDLILATMAETQINHYRVQYDGLKNFDSEDWTLEAGKMFNKIVDVSKEILTKHPDYILLGRVSGYCIFVDSKDKFFIVSNIEKVKRIDSYKRFDSYKELISYYRRTSNLLLHNTDIKRLANRPACFVKLDDLKKLIDECEVKDFTKDDLARLECGLAFQNKTRERLGYDFVSEDMDPIWKKIIERVDRLNIKKYRLSKEKEAELESEGYLRLTQNLLVNLHSRYPKEVEELVLMMAEKATKLVSDNHQESESEDTIENNISTVNNNNPKR